MIKWLINKYQYLKNNKQNDSFEKLEKVYTPDGKYLKKIINFSSGRPYGSGSSGGSGKNISYALFKGDRNNDNN